MSEDIHAAPPRPSFTTFQQLVGIRLISGNYRLSTLTAGPCGADLPIFTLQLDARLQTARWVCEVQPRSIKGMGHSTRCGEWRASMAITSANKPRGEYTVKLAAGCAMNRPPHFSSSFISSGGLTKLLESAAITIANFLDSLLLKSCGVSSHSRPTDDIDVACLTRTLFYFFLNRTSWFHCFKIRKNYITSSTNILELRQSFFANN
ncbi:hypothetical protein WN51_05229 [Melipona quadrifasciata]|uniref:Uncharacterized protein n=1 Tax=Melipona quadrifasciata TaxID=166423 RepID=A0A0M8ZVB6_9HYME|nr:hypothetical protein WN51_05229 [Melipona quadrifasciata]